MEFDGYCALITETYERTRDIEQAIAAANCAGMDEDEAREVAQTLCNPED